MRIPTVYKYYTLLKNCMISQNIVKLKENVHETFKLILINPTINLCNDTTLVICVLISWKHQALFYVSSFLSTIFRKLWNHFT
jgi:hypothetical protein